MLLWFLWFSHWLTARHPFKLDKNAMFFPNTKKKWKHCFKRVIFHISAIATNIEFIQQIYHSQLKFMRWFSNHWFTYFHQSKSSFQIGHISKTCNSPIQTFIRSGPIEISFWERKFMEKLFLPKSWKVHKKGHTLIAQKTELGWIVFGKANELMQKFFEIEEISEERSCSARKINMWLISSTRIPQERCEEGPLYRD